MINPRKGYFRPAGGGEKRWSSPKGRRAYFRKEKQTSRGGYIALVSFLIVSAVVLLIGITLAILAVSEAQMGLSEKRGHYALAFAEGCAEDALLSAYYNATYDGWEEKSYPEGSCTAGVVKDGNNWTITTTATASGHTKKIEVKIDRGDEITINSWKEIE